MKVVRLKITNFRSNSTAELHLEEFAFHNAHFLTPAVPEGEEPTPVPIKIEVVLVEINAEVENLMRSAP
jgi:hypothetical protein